MADFRIIGEVEIAKRDGGWWIEVRTLNPAGWRTLNGPTRFPTYRRARQAAEVVIEANAKAGMPVDFEIVDATREASNEV
ncbi:hypothetical protein ACFOON_17150 [Novosphingobium piscinae]|uniref:DUF1508 domain-containing protein n=1 Tax=Novosphingobium piscinae TaxID=1507448 RepID=A0A7X1FZ34_9SPHN|nr:hypothetical protein [Novosphingobium piscinae]MBC2669519.1 hypothetical protein [Novosphingobium piscinae]